MREVSFIFSVILLFGFLFSVGSSEPVEDKRALLDFVNNIGHSRYLNWKENTTVCNNWTGVSCNEDKSRIIAIRLPGVGFQGPIPPHTISRLSALQVLSLRSNRITGPFPSDFVNLNNLAYLFLQFNRFSGPLPLDFSAWKNLNNIDLSHNAFNGSIPSSISKLTHLTLLNLADNLLSGEVPDIPNPNLKQINLSNNRLTGTLPISLLKFPNSSFQGNNISISHSVVTPPVPSPRGKKVRKLSEPELLGIIIGGCVALLVTSAFLLMLCCFRRKGENELSGKSQKGDKSVDQAVPGGQDSSNKLVFLEGNNYAFDLEDLLRASAEVLGKGTFGTAYKAVLEDATSVVVKRLKEVTAGRREFEQQMDLVGRIRHTNVVELRAYYYSKDEKLMVYDYYSQGNVSALLHGKRGEDRIPLDWDTRLKIAIGAARGIAYIHMQNGGKFVHGNIKSSNIFLNSENYGCVSDLGLITLMSPVAPPISRAFGYRAPEVTDTRKAVQPSDIYSYGVLLLELLTGKSPVHATGRDEVVHLVRWVQSVVREEWTAEVFDVELMRYPNIEEEMVEMLQIAMGCVVRMPEQRPKMQDVVKMVEDVRRLDIDNMPSSETKSESSTPPPSSAVGTESTSAPQ